MRLTKDINLDSVLEIRQWIAEVSRLFDNLGKIKRVRTNTGALDFPSISANSNEDLTITVTGVTAGTHNTVMVGSPSTIEAELTITAFVSADDTVTVRAHNTSSGAVNPVSNTYRVTAIEYEE